MFRSSAPAPVSPPRDAPLGPPRRRQILGELATPVDVLRLLATTPGLRRGPRGDGSVVVDIPGWRAPEQALAPLRRYLAWLGYDARGWALGVNDGSPDASAERLVREKLEPWVRSSGRPLHLVGWSLGGVVAREAARAAPGLVASVVTFGSPIVGGPVHTVAAREYSGEQRLEILRRIEAAEQRPLSRPLTVIYTRRDGIVDWRACLDHATPHAVHYEVDATHFGLGLNPDVWRITARALAGCATGGSADPARARDDQSFGAGLSSSG